MAHIIIMFGVLIFLLVLFFILLGSYQVTVKKQESIKDRLDQYVQAREDGGVGISASATPVGKEQETVKQKTDLWEKFGAIFTPDGLRRHISLQLSAAGIPLRANEFMALVFFSAFAPLVFSMFLLKRFLLGVVFAIFGAIVPFMWVKMKISKRRKIFAAQLLDTLSLMSNSLKAGYSFLQAIELLTKESPSPTREEFRRVVRENSLGVPLETSLESMAKRMGSRILIFS
jgi:tight adherence protein B